MMMVSPYQGMSVSASTLFQGLVDDADLPALQFSGITSNSQTVKPGYLFIAQAGLMRHAIDFVPQAVEAGAVAVAYDKHDSYCRQRIALLEKQLKVNWIALPDLQKLTGEIASRFYSHPDKSFKLIGITGTDGKTSVTHLLVQALVRLHKKAGSIGTLGYGLANQLTMTNYTTPDAITLQSILFELQLRECEYVVMEVSSHALEQYRVSGCNFEVAALTNLGSDHLDYHGTVEHYAAAKSMLFELPGLRKRVLNAEDDLGQRLKRKYYTQGVVDFSVRMTSNPNASVTLQHSEMSEYGLAIKIKVPQGVIQIQTGLIGSFNIENCLTCVAVLLSLGFDKDQIEQSMQKLKPIPGRMEYFPASEHQAAVVIDFAHTEQALKACLEAVKLYTRGELYCVFGCGGDRDQSKRPRMAAVAEQFSDHVFLTDDNPRNEPPQKIMQDVLNGFEKPDQVRVIHDRYHAIEAALQQACKDDLVVIAGKGHEQIQIIGDQRLPFSDHSVIRELRKGDNK